MKRGSTPARAAPQRTRPAAAPAHRPARGGSIGGFIVGVLVGLGAALAVALYVSKVPVPFINKVPQRTAEQDAAEAERNKNWNPNAGLSGDASTPAAASAPAPAAPLRPAAAPTATNAPAGAPPAAAVKASPRTSNAAASAAGDDPFVYYAQAGAFTRNEEAEAQRAKLALQGLDAKVIEREQAGRTVYRVRVGPFDQRAGADAVITQLRAVGEEAALVRVQRP